MNFGKARIIDSTFGILVCQALSLFKWMWNQPGDRAEQPVTFSKILLIKFWGMGSIVLASPAIRAIRQRYPEAKLTFFTFKGNQSILDALQLTDDVVEIENGGIFRFVLALPAIFWRLRQRRFDLVVDFEFFTRFSAMASYIVCRGERIGFFEGLAQRGSLQTRRVPFEINRHVVDNFLNLAQAVDADISDRSLAYLHTPPEDDRAVEAYLREQGAGTAIPVAINVNASTLSLQRRWPLTSFVHVAEDLLDFRNVPVILLGAPAEKRYVDDAARQINSSRPFINAAGQLTVSQLLSLFKRCRLLVSNDSGPLHFAAALQLPTVSFFGPESPVLYGPMGEKHRVFYKNLYCSPCLHAINAKKITCHENKCLAAINEAEVIAAVGTMLEEQDRGAAE